MRSIAVIAIVCSGCDYEVGIGENLDTGDPVVVQRIDRDNDGFTFEEGDCNDSDSDIGPGDWFEDVCDGKDNNCDGAPDLHPGSGVHVCSRSENYLQTLRLDVLFVIDTSYDMNPYRGRIAEGAAAFLGEMVGDAHDTHIGVITMNMESPLHMGQLVEAPTPLGSSLWIDGDVVDLDSATDWLYAAVLEGEPQATGREGGRDAVDQAIRIQSDATNTGFFRSDADLVLVFVSDEEDKSDNEFSHNTDVFLETLRAHRGSQSKISIHSIVQLDDTDCSGLYSPVSRGVSYVDLADLTAGTTLSLCELDYDQYLGTVGQISANQGLESRFMLPLPAQEAATTHVKLVLPTGSERILDYDEGEYALIESNSTLLLLIEPLPPPRTQILVDYLQDY